MARAASPDSAGLPFFICLRRRFLDGGTRRGRVIDGWTRSTRSRRATQNGVVANPDKIIRMRVAADVKK
jgi:peptidylprolyl isomerase